MIGRRRRKKQQQQDTAAETTVNDADRAVRRREEQAARDQQEAAADARAARMRADEQAWQVIQDLIAPALADLERRDWPGGSTIRIGGGARRASWLLCTFESRGKDSRATNFVRLVSDGTLAWGEGKPTPDFAPVYGQIASAKAAGSGPPGGEYLPGESFPFESVTAKLRTIASAGQEDEGDVIGTPMGPGPAG